MKNTSISRWLLPFTPKRIKLELIFPFETYITFVLFWEGRPCSIFVGYSLTLFVDCFDHISKTMLAFDPFCGEKKNFTFTNKSYLHISKTFHSKRIFFQYLYRIRLEAILDRCIRYVVWWEFQATNFGLEFDAYKNDKNKIWLKVLEFPASLIEKKSYCTEGLCICLAFFFCFTTFKKPTLPQGVSSYLLGSRWGSGQ